MSTEHTFRRLLIATFGPLVAAVLILVALGAGAVSVLTTSVDELVFRVQPMQRLNSELRGTVLDSSRGLRGYTHNGDVAFREAYDRGRQSYGRTKDELLRLASASEQHTARRSAELADRWFGVTATVRSAARGSVDTASSLASGSEVMDEFLESSAALAVALDATSASLQQSSDATRRQVLLVLISGGALAVFLATASAITTARRLGGSIEGLRSTVTRWAAGDAEARIPQQGIAELQEIARAINALADEATRLRDVEVTRQRYQEIAAEIGFRIREHLDVDAVIERTTSEIGEHFDAERVCVWLAENAPEDGVATLAIPEWRRPEVPPLSSLLAAEERLLPLAPLQELYAGHGSPQVCGAEEVGGLGLPVALRENAVLVLPFGRGETVLGVLCVARAADGWRAVEVGALGQVASDLARGVDQARLHQEQQRLIRELRALDRDKSEFVSNVSHELRTPMTSIAGYVELLRDGASGTLTGGQRKMLEIVHRNTARLRRLVEELLLLAKLQSGSATTAEEAVDVGELLDSVVESVRPAADGSGVRLDHDRGGELVVLGDRVHLGRLLTNLVSNAVKFTPAGGEVRVACRRCRGDWVEVRVSDAGIGIPAAEQHAVFARFYRASNAAERAIPGSGLGLAIVEQIVQRHGGRVALASAEGVGTTVTVHLPAARPGGTR